MESNPAALGGYRGGRGGRHPLAAWRRPTFRSGLLCSRALLREELELVSACDLPDGEDVARRCADRL